MKKLISIFAVCCLVVAMCAGCGDNKETTAKDKDGVPTLSWYVPGSKQSDMPAVMDEVNKLLVPKIGAKLDLRVVDDNAYDEKTKLMQASGEKYDLCFSGYINKLDAAVKKNSFLELDKYIENTDFWKNFPEYAKKACTINGHVYAIANLQILCSGLAAYFRKDLADEFGLDMKDIHNMEDIEPFAKWVTEKHPEYYAINPGGGEVVRSMKGMEDVFYDTIADVVLVFEQPDGSFKAMPNYEYDDYFNYYRMLSDWFQKGYIRKDVASTTSMLEDLNAGKYAVWFASNKPGGVEEHNISKKFEAVKADITVDYMPYNSGRSTMIAVGKNSQNPEKAVKLIEVMNTDKDIYNMVCFGIEGKHYTLDSDKKVNYIDGAGYKFNASWKFGNQFNAMLLKGQPDNVWKDTITLNEGAKRSKLLGFELDNYNIRVELTQLSNVTNKYKVLKNGSEPFDSYYDKYVQELKQAGIEKVVAEVQRQLDEFIKNTK